MIQLHKAFDSVGGLWEWVAMKAVFREKAPVETSVHARAAASVSLFAAIFYSSMFKIKYLIN